MTKPKAKVKKGESDKDVSSAGSATDNKGGDGPTPGSSSPSSSHKTMSTVWFTSEIQAMMHGFGDCRRPLFDSARLIEEIVHQQMNSLLLQLAEVATNRGARFIGLEDIVFLLRKDKVKLARLIRYLGIRDLKASVIKGVEDVADDPSAEAAGDSAVKAMTSPVKKRQKVCQDFVNIIDQTGELISLFEDGAVMDEIKQERDIRIELFTRNMDTAQYVEFAEARRVGFTRKYRSTKFRDWILKDNLTEIKPSTIALEILNYLAYETVAQIVDLALLVKRDAAAQTDDPLGRIMAPQCFNPSYPSVRLYQLTKAGPSTSGTPPQSPRWSISPPTSPGTQPGTSTQGSHPSPGASSAGHQSSGSAGAAAKAKSKKRKKSGGGSNPDLPYANAIHPSDIREAIRRYFQPSGPLVPFSKANTTFLGRRLLCC